MKRYINLPVNLKYHAALLAAILIISLAGTSFAQPKVPKLTEWITDLTGTLSNQQKTILAKKLITYNDTTSNQIAVLVIPSLDGTPIEDYALEVGRQNKIGTKQLNNGILFLIVKNDKKLRIEVGPGLEGALPDALAASILRDEVSPYFKQSLYFEGMASGIDAIIKATAGEYHANPVKHKEKKKSTGFGSIIFIILLLLFIFTRGRIGFLPFFFGGFGGGGGGGSNDGGFGGFSGGGGDFGGGGASGDW